MSVNYASGLSSYAYKGICGLPEFMDSTSALEQKLNELYQLMRQSKFTVVHTGAGISTSSGIPDFRGPNGVWTMEKLGKEPCRSVAFEHAVPSLAHRALVELERRDLIQYLITQNIDGLHLRSGFPRDRLSILHGDMFLERCRVCGTLYVRSSPSQTMGLKCTDTPCTFVKVSSRPCRGKLHDTILDWENDLPELDYNLAIERSKSADLHVCIGTSLQMYPAASLPLMPTKPKGSARHHSEKVDESSHHSSKLVIINLQKAKLANRAWLNIYAKADMVFGSLLSRFGIDLASSTEAETSFHPMLVMRSSHSNPNVNSPWRVLPHPTDGADVHIVETWSDIRTELKPNKIDCKQERFSESHRNFSDDEPECKRWKTEDVPVAASVADTTAEM